MAEVTLLAALADFADEDIALILASAPLKEDIHTSSLVGEILYRRNEPERWVRICEAALKPKGLELERRIALGLEKVNGIRRMAGLWDIKRVRGILGSANSLIRSLSDTSPAKSRLQGLSLYHEGIVEHAGGNFIRASFCQQFAVTLPGTSLLAQAIGKFMAVNELINRSLVEDGLPSKELLSQFSERDQDLQDTLDLSTPEGRRWNLNRLCFRQRAAWLCGQMMSEADIVEIFRAKEEFGSSFDHCFAVLNGALQAKRRREFKMDDALAPHIDLDWRSEGLLVMAQSAHIMGMYFTMAEVLSRRIFEVEAQGHGGHVARAMARRMSKLAR